jgi:putative phosphoribosyl transferase
MIAFPPRRAALFQNREHAGQVLAESLRSFAGRNDVIVLGLPRGGAPVAYQVACALQVPWDVFLVRKLGVPGHEELAMGAIASGGVCVPNEPVIRDAEITPREFEEVAARARQELARREQVFRGNRPVPNLHGKTVILVDDGLATGSTMHAAVQAVRHLSPAHIVVAVPVAAESTRDEFFGEVDQIVCAFTPRQFRAVGLYYDDFSQTTDAEVCELLHRRTAADTTPSAN